MKARLLETVELAPGVRHFEFEVPELAELTFTPGQFVSLKQTVDGKEIIRPYSIASAAKGNRFALCLNKVEGGLVSPHLFTLAPGAEIEINAPIGYFTLRRPESDALFIATGTGIAPFRSMLNAHLPGAGGKMTLLFGTRYEQTLLYRDELETLAAQHPRFHFWPTLTRAEASWTGRTGRVQAHLDEALAGRTDVDIYLCGLKEMVDDVRAHLKQRGFDRKRIVYEKYD